MTSADTARLSERACKQRDADAAIALLDHSVALNHGRIALIRYLHAQFLGAPLQARHDAYVAKVASGLSPDALARIAAAAREKFLRAS